MMIHMCKKRNMQGIVDELRKNPTSLSEVDDQLRTPFWWLCFQENFECIKFLIEKYHRNLGYSIYQPDYQGRTPFWWLCYTGNFECIKFLVDKHFEKLGDSIYRADNWGRTPFWELCNKNHFKCVKFLVDNHSDKLGDSICRLNYYGETPFWIICNKGNLELMKLFVKNRESKEKFSFCENFCLDLDESYVEISEDVICQPNIYGETPFYILCKKGYYQCVEYMLKNFIFPYEKFELLS